jgi:Mg/Co/Ni transporter MgtE
MKKNKGYIDTLNSTFMGYKSNELKLLINQPKIASFMKNDTSKYCFADLTYQEMVSIYEKKYQEIKLNNCDSINKLGDQYTCENIIDKQARDFIILDIRNQKIVNLINEYQSKKVAVIYGKNHLVGILEILKKQDSNWMIKN